MLNRNFRLIVICLLATLVVCAAGYGIYSRKKYQSYLGSGRVTDIQSWSAKASISWAISIILSMIIVAQIIIEE